MKKCLILILSFLVMIVAVPVFAQEESKGVPSIDGFIDVKDSNWAKEQIEQAVQKGYVSGFPDGTFRPDEKVTRAQFMRMLVDALKLPHVEQGSPWYQPYVAALIETGIHKEKDFKSGYDANLSRLEMVRLAVRAVSPGIDNNENAGDDNWLVFKGTEKGILHGVGAGKLDLQGTSTRAQAVAIIERILSVNEGKKLPVDKYAMSSAELAWHRTNVFTVMPEFIRTQYPFEVEQGLDPIDRWDVSKMTLVSNDGKYKGTLEKVIAIDLADPKDPNRYLLGDINELYWYNHGPVGNRVPVEKYPIKSHTDSYIIYYETRMDYNKDPKLYGKNDAPSFAFSGDIPTDQQMMDFLKGTLNQPATVFRKTLFDTPAIIIPKKIQVKYKDLSIGISTPSKMGVEVTNNVIIRVAGPGHPYVTP